MVDSFYLTGYRPKDGINTVVMLQVQLGKPKTAA